nr:RNA polymerase II elongation factor ELL [Hymenolepis microstoma]
MPIRLPEHLYKLYRDRNDDIEIYSVKLTDSALRALDNCQSTPVKLSVNGSQGTLSIPSKQSCVSYDLNISPFHQSVDATTDVIQLSGSRAINLGKTVSKLTVQAKADSFSAAKMKMAEAEDQRKGYAKANIMPNNKRTNIRDPNLKSRSILTPPPRNGESRISPTALARNSSPLANKSPVNTDVASRSLRDRIIHLLAVQPYQRPELLLRLKRDGLTDEQKDKVDAILSKVGRTGRQGEFHLSPAFINLVEANWPGYSPSERSNIASLKARVSTNSPGSRLSLDGARVTPTSQKSSPQAIGPTQPVASVAEENDFGRKPTRASAPAAPHPLTKKIAALDLLASGLSLPTVASRHNIPIGVLENWKKSEQSLRERYANRRKSTIPQPIVDPLSSFQQDDATTAKTVMSNGTTTIGGHPESDLNRSGGANSKPSSPKRARLSSSSNESGIHSCSPISINCGNGLQQSASSSTRRSSATIPSQPLPVANQPASSTSISFKDPSPPSTNKRPSPIATTARKRTYDTTLNDGEEYSRRSNVPAPATLTSTSRQMNGGGCGRRTNDRGSESSFCLDSSSPPGEVNSPVSQFYARGSVADTNKMTGDKVQRFDAGSNEEKADVSSEDDLLYNEISNQSAKIERQYPPITNARQAASYRETFESVYPQYLKLHEHYRLAWDKVITLKHQIMALNGGQDNQKMARLAKELDDFLNRMRKPERREEEIKLLVMSHKLQHLKHQLADYAARLNAGTSGESNSSSLRAGASD